jgi:recombinational DNA repair protein (RecF pathway)
MKTYCADCGKELPTSHFTVIAGEVFCQTCEDKLIRQYLETAGFAWRLEQDFSTKKTENGRHYG